MLILATHYPFYRRAGLALVLAQLSLCWLKTEPFHYGTWHQIEPMLLGVLVLAAANALWLCTGFARRWIGLAAPIHPLFFCLLAFVAWQWIASALAASPWQSWFGHPAIGEGAAYYTAMAMACLTISALWWELRYRKIMLAVAAGNLVLLSLSYINLEDICRRLLATPIEMAERADWADYLVFPVGYFWLAFMGSGRVRTPARYAWVMILTCIIIFCIAGNHTAQYIFRPVLVIGGVFLGLWLRGRPAWLRPGKIWRGLAIAGCFLPVAWIALSALPEWKACMNSDLATRAGFNMVGLSALASEPARLLVGNGFGGFANDVSRYALIDGAYAYSGGRWESNWKILNSVSYHAHNEAMEMLLSLGIPGLLLWLSLPVAVLLTLPRQRFWWVAPMLVAMTAIQGFWFFLPQVLAYQAMSWAALASGMRQTLRPSASLRVPAIICAVLAVAMVWSAHAQWRAMEYGQRLNVAVKSEPVDEYSVEWLHQDMARGGDRLRQHAWFFGKWMTGRLSDHTSALSMRLSVVTARDIDWYKRFIEAAAAAAQEPRAGAWIGSLALWLDNMALGLVDEDGALSPVKPLAKATMPGAVLSLARIAPGREDLAAPFLYNLDAFTGNDPAKTREMLQKILEIAPNHRSAMWLMGRELRRSPATAAEGEAMMARAIGLGVQRVFPVVHTPPPSR